MLTEILHDWGDAECVAILSAIRRAAAPGATVLVIENVLLDEELDPGAQTLDVLMLAVTGGRERNGDQLSGPAGEAGLAEELVIKTAGRLRVVEARAV